MKTELITKTELSEILKDIFKGIADTLDEQARQEHTGRDESAALSQVSFAFAQAEPEWHVNDVLSRKVIGHGASMFVDPPKPREEEIDLSDPTVGKTPA